MTRLYALVAVLGLLVACGGGGDGGLVLTSTHGPLTLKMHMGSTIVGESADMRLVVTRGDRPALGTASIEWSMDGMPMKDRARQLVPATPGTYEQRAFAFPMSGKWHARVSFHDSDRIATVATFTVDARD